MALEIVSYFMPLRMSLKRQEPVQLKVSLRNLSESTKKLAVNVNLAHDLSFGKGGYKARELLRLELKPFETKALYFDIFPKPNTKEGEHIIEIIAQEFSDDYEVVKEEYIHKAELIAS